MHKDKYLFWRKALALSSCFLKFFLGVLVIGNLQGCSRSEGAVDSLKSVHIDTRRTITLGEFLDSRPGCIDGVWSVKSERKSKDTITFSCTLRFSDQDPLSLSRKLHRNIKLHGRSFRDINTFEAARLDAEERALMGYPKGARLFEVWKWTLEEGGDVSGLSRTLWVETPVRGKQQLDLGISAFSFKGGQRTLRTSTQVMQNRPSSVEAIYMRAPLLEQMYDGPLEILSRYGFSLLGLPNLDPDYVRPGLL
ncbi:MAG: hypothetical protein ACXIUB_03495 [Wenzhouxiangella sp.]